MQWIDLIGWVAAVVGAFYALPQMVRVIRAKSTAGLSLRTWQFQVTANLGWSVHGLITSQPTVLWANVVVLASGAVILWRIVRDRAFSPLIWALPLVSGALLLGIDHVFGAAAFGVTVMIPQSMSMLTQFRALWHAVDFTGVSWSFMAFAIFTQILWFGYALPRREVAIIIGTVITAALQGASLVLYLARRVGWVPSTVRAAGAAPVKEPGGARII